MQANIEEFGGDPDNVTIFGESSGGTNVLALLLIDAAQGLFHRAIAQSSTIDSVSRGEAENELDAAVPGHRHSATEIAASLLEELEASTKSALVGPNSPSTTWIRCSRR